jgi:hypothetical protein
MPQIIDPGQGFGAQLGAALGGGFSSGLQYLAQHKLNLVIERQTQKRDKENFESAGFTPQESQFLASQPAQLRPNYIKQLRPSGIGTQQAQAPTQQLQEQAITPQEQQQVGLQDLMASLNPRSQSNPAQRQLEQVTGGQGQGFLQGLLNTQQPQIGQQGSPESQEMQPRNTVGPQQQQQAAIAQPKSKQKSVAESLTQPTQTAAERNFALKEQALESKASHETAKGINTAFKSARDSDTRLDRMAKLADTGKLNSPLFAGLVKGIKIPIIGHIGLPQGWLTPESQEFDKLSTDFVKGAKDIFGSRMTQGEVDLFLKTVPSLTNSDEGKKVLIRNLKIMNEGAKVKKEALDSILKLNGGRYPANLDSLVEEVAGPKLEDLKEKFIAGDEKLASQSFEGLPDPSTVSGKKFRDKKTGEIVQSVDGKYVKVS